MRDLDKIKAAQLADARGNRAKDWIVITFHRWEARIKSATSLGVAVAGLWALGSRAWHYMKAREVAPAELPATGQPTIATEFVKQPPKP
jgi:hypothetical protein